MPWLLTGVLACGSDAVPAAPVAGVPASPRVLGSDRWRVPARAAGLVWRGDTLVTVADDALYTIDADGAVRREALPEPAAAVVSAGSTLWIGTAAGDVVGADGERRGAAQARIGALDLGDDGALTALAAGPADHRRQSARVAQWDAAGRPTGTWTVPDCAPRGIAALGEAIFVACGRSPSAWLAPGAEPLRLAWRAEAADAGAGLVVTAGPDGVAAWRALGTRPVRTIGGAAGAVSIAPAGSIAWSTPTEVVVDGARAAAGRADALAWSPDGRTLAGRAGTRVWRVPAGGTAPAPALPEAHDAAVVAVALSEAGGAAASVSLDNVALRWDVASGRCVEAWALGRGHPAAVALVGERLVVALGAQVIARDGAQWALPEIATGLSVDAGALLARTRGGWFRLEAGGAVPVPEPVGAPAVSVRAFPGSPGVTAAAAGAAGYVTGHDDGTVRVWSRDPP